MGQDTAIMSGEVIAFKHPLFMNLIMFAGEAVLLLIYKLFQCRDK
jgi:hypothetical protein